MHSFLGWPEGFGLQVLLWAPAAPAEEIVASTAGGKMAGQAPPLALGLFQAREIVTLLQGERWTSSPGSENGTALATRPSLPQNQATP
jgi:hypothetical protein